MVRHPTPTAIHLSCATLPAPTEVERLTTSEYRLYVQGGNRSSDEVGENFRLEVCGSGQVEDLQTVNDPQLKTL